MTPAQKRRGESLPEECLAVRIPQAAQLIGVGRTSVYQLIATGALETIKIGRATLIPMETLRTFVEQRRSKT